MHKSTEDCSNVSYQFSVRALFAFTTVAAILVVIAAACRDSRYFHAFWSLHALIAVLPLFGVCFAHATACVSGRWLAVMSLAIFGVALATPAIRLAGDLTFGCIAFLLSFVGIGLFSEWGSNDEHFWYPIACTAGALTNIAFIAGYIAFVAFIIWQRGIFLARCAATVGSCLALLVMLPLCLSGELNGIYIGYGLWAASILALALGSWRTKLSLDRSSIVSTAEN